MNVILQELGITICITLIASLFISQTLIPLAATKLLRSQSKPKASPIISWLQNQYEVILVYTLKYFWIALVALAAGLFSIYYSSKNVNLNLTPSPAATFVSIGIDIGGARSLEVTEKIIEQVEQSLLPHKDDLNIDSVYSFWSESVALTRLYMKTGHQNESDMNVVRKRLPSLLPEIPGVKLQVQDNTPFWQRNSGKRVAVSLSGPDSELLGEIAEQALAKIEPIDGLFDFYTTAEGGRLELHSELDRDKMHQYGIAPNQPASSVELTFRGRRLASFKGEDGEVEMRLVLDEAQSTSISDLKNVTLNQANESQVTLDSIAEFSTQKGPNRIRRQNKLSSVWVGARFESGKRNEYRNQIVEILSEMSLPPGYEWEFNSRWRGQEEMEWEFIVNGFLAIILIIFVMAGLFESLSQSLSMIISMVFAVSGALWTLFITGIDLDQPAMVAFFLLLGVVVNNGIVMTEHINLYRRDGWPRDQAMIRGGKERLRPIIMTAVTTLVGLIPIIVQKPSLGGVYYYSMAYVIIGGLFVSTIATGLLLPAMIKCIEFAVGFIIGVFKLILGRATTIDWDELKHPTPKKSVEV